MRVLFSPEVRKSFQDLEEVLFNEEYFSFEESAIRYVKELVYEIEANLPNHTKRKAPGYFDKYGKDLYYSTFRKNKVTQWYVFFSIYKRDNGLIYLIKHISNNHVDAHHL